MDTKPIKPKRASVYEPEELEPRDHAADDARVEAWIERNREQIDRDLAEAREQIKQGKCTTYRSANQFVTDSMRALKARKKRLKK